MEDLLQKLTALSTRGAGEEEGEQADLPKVLEEVTLRGVVKHIRKLASSENRE